MISLHPMIVSRTVSKVALPVIAKAVEKFIVVYRFDDVVQHANRMGQGPYKIKAGRVTKTIREQTKKSDTDEYSDDIERIKQDKARMDRMGGQFQKGEFEDAEREQKAKSATVRIGDTDMKSISLEPTWINVDLQVGAFRRTAVIGVKVIPAIAKSDEQLSNVLMYDRGANFAHRMAIKFGRWAVNQVLRGFEKAWAIATFRGQNVKAGKYGSVTGDVRKDILQNRTIYSINPKRKSSVFVCLSSHDVSDDFFNSAGGVASLFKMGWTSIIIADDVNRVAHFCMEEYKGQCVSIPYAILYNTFSSMQVYDSLSDAKKSAGALFKTRFRVAKITSNLLAKRKLAKYRGR